VSAATRAETQTTPHLTMLNSGQTKQHVHVVYNLTSHKLNAKCAALRYRIMNNTKNTESRDVEAQSFSTITIHSYHFIIKT